jgi:hypothetical protein
MLCAGGAICGEAPPQSQPPLSGASPQIGPAVHRRQEPPNSLGEHESHCSLLNMGTNRATRRQPRHPFNSPSWLVRESRGSAARLRLAGEGAKKAWSSVAHRARPQHTKTHPLHVTWRIAKGLPNMRSPEVMKAFRRAFVAGKSRFGFRLVLQRAGEPRPPRLRSRRCPCPLARHAGLAIRVAKRQSRACPQGQGLRRPHTILAPSSRPATCATPWSTSLPRLARLRPSRARRIFGGRRAHRLAPRGRIPHPSFAFGESRSCSLGYLLRSDGSISTLGGAGSPCMGSHLDAS